MVNTHRTIDLGRVSGSLAEALAWLTSPAAIAGEIAALERAQAQGDTSAVTAVLLKDWRGFTDYRQYGLARHRAPPPRRPNV